MLVIQVGDWRKASVINKAYYRDVAQWCCREVASHYIPLWANRAMKLVYMEHILGEAQPRAETVSLHNYGLEETLEWFGQWPSPPLTEQEAADGPIGSGSCCSSGPITPPAWVSLQKGLTCLLSLLPMDAHARTPTVTLKWISETLRFLTNVATHVFTVCIPLCSKYIWEDLSSDKRSLTWKGPYSV